MTDGMKSGQEAIRLLTIPATTHLRRQRRLNKIQKHHPRRKPTSETKNHISKRSERPDSSTGPSEEDLPYIFGRSGVKEDREMIQYFLRDETEDLEAEVKHAVEQELGTDVYLTDIREALVRIGANHIDEVADELRGWGYRYREDTN